MFILDYVENKETSEFYPTPEPLVEKMIEGIDFGVIETILEPSAGKGDILKAIARKINDEYSRWVSRRRCDVDAIEIDPNLRAILKHNFSDEYRRELQDKIDVIKGKYGRPALITKYAYVDKETGEEKSYPKGDMEKIVRYQKELDSFFTDSTDDEDGCRYGVKIVHDDFLTYQAHKEYQLIIMNPPFSNGDKHLLKALEIQRYGGYVVCLLNAETIRNPYTETRKTLVSLLKKYDASIEYLSDAFSDSERKTDVEVALIKVNIPYGNNNEMSIFEKMQEDEQYQEPDPEEVTDLEITDYIKMIVNRYSIEIRSGIELIRTYCRMKPYLSRDITDKSWPIIKLCDSQGRDMNINKYVRAVRLKYWEALLSNRKFMSKLTSDLQERFRRKVRTFADYDFSEYNIQTLITEMNANIKTGIESEIDKMYDSLTLEHSYYPECSNNRHYYDGWKTNKAWKIGKKCILPCYGIFSPYSKGPQVREAYGALSDIERILNFFDGNMTADVDLARQLEINFNSGITKNVECKFFKATFYKKGTVHIVFNYPELIDRYNIYSAKNRKWLPPSYGKKSYKEMNAEEKAVIDSFQGEQEYSKVMSRPEYYLAPPAAVGQTMLALEME